MKNFFLSLQQIIATIGMPFPYPVELPMVKPVTSYIYSPGLGGSPITIGRYCPYYEAPTGEVVMGTMGGNVFGDGKRVSTVVFSEIDLSQPTGWFRKKVGVSIARSVFKSRFGIVVKENPDASETILNYIFDCKAINIGQAADVARLRAVYLEHVGKFTHGAGPVVMFGDSRGAATTFNFIAEDHPPISCAVIEGVFDSLPHLIKHIGLNNKWGWVEDMLTGMLTGIAGDYNHEGPFPIHYVERFPYDTPVLLVTSLEDEVVPYQCTMNLYCRLVESGHTNIRLLILPTSRHDAYMIHGDKDIYEACVHAFYRSCGVEHNGQLADKGEAILATTRPSAAEIRQNYLCCK